MPTFQQPLFDDAPPVPYQGKTAESRASSFSGAVHAATTFTKKTDRYVRILRRRGPTTDQDAADLLHCAIGSVNSIRGSLPKGLIRSFGKTTKVWPDGKRPTTRTQWGLARTE